MEKKYRRMTQNRSTYSTGRLNKKRRNKKGRRDLGKEQKKVKLEGRHTKLSC